MESHESIAVVLVDTTGTIRYWSAGATTLFGHPDAVGQTLDVIVPDEFRAQHWSGFRKAMETGEAASSGGRFNIPIRCADGRARSFPGTFSLLCDGHGRAIGGVGTWSQRTGDEEPFTPITHPA
ncbi:PAS domain-containing protein [Nocardia sp. alder85J]|uniref:PAS domain-containing protein n=1 Tax=Nocardia sp. alder85J TaxID=2862949 RepID=UPI001CD5BC54|nr:PAS domain-containing protein [Nocardia sp. alder85J]MCX4091967.1 PAS domain-containing protein [Nocardia sp. alder85J]